MHAPPHPEAVTPRQVDVLIVGAGPAALYAIFQLGLLGVHSVALDVLPQAGGQCAQLYPQKPIYDIPAIPQSSGAALVQSLLEQIRPFTHPAAESPVKVASELRFDTLVSGMTIQPDGRFEVETRTSQGQASRFACRAVVLAAGVGAFLPKKPVIEGLSALEGNQVVYQTPQTNAVQGQHVVIQGDDDLALSFVIELGEALLQQSPKAPASVSFLYRRDVLNAEPATEAHFRDLVAQGVVRFLVGQAVRIDCEPSGRMRGLQIALSQDGTQVALAADLWIPLLGLSPKLGPLEHWGLAMNKKAIEIDPGTCETSQQGIFAIGDLAHYPGKRKLIVSGFQDATQAAYTIAERLHGHKIVLQYTTASKELHARLGRTTDALDNPA
jgi:thioredoxin reductase (NADPH)